MSQQQKLLQQQLDSTKSTNNSITSRTTTTGSGKINNKLQLSPNGTQNQTITRKQSSRDREKEKTEREFLVLWRRPIQTIKYCNLEVIALLQHYGKK